MTELLTRAAAKVSSVNVEARTADVIFATETPVRRRRYDVGEFLEVLTVTREAIDTKRLDSMQVLDSHNTYTLEARLGSVVPGSFRIEAGQAIATIKLSRKQKAQELLDDLADGHSLPISVGYSVEHETRKDGERGTLPTITATRWTPMEISVVPVQADPASKTRNRETTMTTELETQERPADHKMRVRERRALVTEIFGRDGDFLTRHAEEVEELIEDTRGKTEQQVRDAILNLKVDIEERTPTFPHVETRGMQDAQETTRKLVANAIMHRHGLTTDLMAGANQYRDMSALDIARDLLQQRGESHRGSPSDIVRRSLHTTSDFPIILGEVTRQTLMSAYSAAGNTFSLFANRNVVQDLRDVSVLELGSAPQLEKVNEKGEYKRGTIKESKESFSMAHYGKTFGLTEAMLINDQLGAFEKLIQSWGREVARLEGDIVWSALLENWKIRSDNTALFHASHGNLAGTGTALDETNLIAARKAMRLQKDIDGRVIGLTPKFVFVGTDNELVAQKLLQGVTSPTTAADVVPQAIKDMQPVYEHRIDSLSAKAWFLFADPAETLGRGLQYSYLAGFEAPRTKERWGFDYDGVEYRIDHYFGAGLTDYRFAYKNPGQ